MTDSENDIHRSLGRIEGMLVSVDARLDAFDTLYTRVNDLEKTRDRWSANLRTAKKYSLPGLAIAFLALVPEPVRKFLLAVFM